MLQHAIELTGQDRLDEALAMLKRTIDAAPNFLDAHVEYLRVASLFLGRDDEVRVEYEALMAKDPRNPVYPMAMALEIRGSSEMGWYRRVAEEAPEWSWGHYARAFLILGRTYTMINEQLGEKGDRMLAEFSLALQRDPGVAAFYTVTIAFQRLAGHIDQAVARAERMSRQPKLRAQGLAQLWRLRLALANGSAEAKAALQTELDRLAKSSRDLELLVAIREAYATLLKDADRADGIERRLHGVDPGWYPERGKAWFVVSLDSSGRPYAIRTANRQYALYQKVAEMALQREPDWRKAVQQYEAVLPLSPNAGLTKWIDGILFARARAAKDVDGMVRYAERLRSLDPGDAAPFAAVASVMADQGIDLGRAFGYARVAERNRSRSSTRRTA